MNVSRLRTDWVLLVGFCGFLFFFGLSSFGLLGADEPRYAQVAREMLARHDWVTPTLNGRPWLEKPPLYYWQAMASYSVFGVSDWAARLPSAIDASCIVLAVYFFLRRFRPGFHLDGALMTASAAGIVGFARAASTDMPLAASFTIALLAWYGWYESKSKTYLAAFYALLALGTLAKGPVAPFLAFAIIFLFSVARNDFAPFWRTLWTPGILVFCVVALPWYIAAQLRNPDFLRVFILQHNLERFSTNLYRHHQPFWFYIPVALLALLPWVVFVLASLWETIRAWWNERREMFLTDSALDGFLVLWFFVPIVFFSMSQSKLPGYILPAVPAGTLLLAEYGRRHLADDDRPPAALIILHSIVAATPLAAGLMIQYLLLQHRLPWGRAAEISCALAAVVAVGIALTLWSRAGMMGSRFVLVPVVLAIAAVLRLGSPTLDATLSARPLAAEIGRLETHPLPLAVFRVRRETEYGLAFYRNQAIIRYERDPQISGEHLVVAPSGSQTDLATQVLGRRVSYLGSFAAQGLDYFWVAGETDATR